MACVNAGQKCHINLETGTSCEHCAKNGHKCSICPRFTTNQAVRGNVGRIIISHWHRDMINLKTTKGSQALPERPPVIPIAWKDALNKVVGMENGERPLITMSTYASLTVGKRAGKAIAAKPSKVAAVATRSSSRTHSKTSAKPGKCLSFSRL